MKGRFERSIRGSVKGVLERYLLGCKEASRASKGDFGDVLVEGGNHGGFEGVLGMFLGC